MMALKNILKIKMMENIKKNQFKYRVPDITAYFTLLYFFEVIYIMFILLISSGKTTAVIIGLISSVLLSYHIISLFLKKNLNRKIQLFLMDIHFAYALAYIINALAVNTVLINADRLILFIRIIIVIFELPLIYFLTDEKVKKHYYKPDTIP